MMQLMLSPYKHTTYDCAQLLRGAIFGAITEENT